MKEMSISIGGGFGDGRGDGSYLNGKGIYFSLCMVHAVDQKTRNETGSYSVSSAYKLILETGVENRGYRSLMLCRIFIVLQDAAGAFLLLQESHEPLSSME